MYKLSILMAMLVLTGCASVAGEKFQPVSIQTIHENKEVSGIGCNLSNDAGNWFVTSPGSVMVHKSTGDLIIDCKKGSLAGNNTLVSKSNGAVWGNILLGGGIGYIVDRNTGAGFDYPNTTTVLMRETALGPVTPVPPQAAADSFKSTPLPAAQ
ncbi:hypothetical protein [Janthinobacterium sp.]|uniref:hypothetical protein n=1 Tax=Janthinobacterium sp. TaxID=1871054 RepID=UPI0026020510|nr:hypothetical protein [Janthinobacterium sp.]